jgi:hypothetical protein
MARARVEKLARAKAPAQRVQAASRDYGSGRLAALQRMADAATAGQVHQRAAEEEEEPLQGKAIQRAGMPEEEEELQMKPIQRASLEEEEPLQGKAIQRADDRANNTGMPDGLKAGVESLSGQSLDGVRVHYNSEQPAAVQAHAFAQGNDIHVAPGQERHLPHEAWHVVQQAQGRVAPTTEVAGQPVNDDAGLEREADVMGHKALSADREQ